MEILTLMRYTARIEFLTGNRIINAAIVAWVIAQVAKTIIDFFSRKKLNFRRMIGSGGMPSSHSATVCAVATVACKICGVHSPEFGIACAFAVIVMYDASNVRRAAGEQAKIINYMLKNWQTLTPEIFGRELKELLGHTPFQVIIGAMLGIATGILL